MLSRGEAMQNLARLVTRVFAALKKCEWLPILLARLAMGYEFVSSGWGKLHALEKLTAYFVQLKLPGGRIRQRYGDGGNGVGGGLYIAEGNVILKNDLFEANDAVGFGGGPTGGIGAGGGLYVGGGSVQVLDSSFLNNQAR